MDKKIISTNKKAFFNFTIIETYESGIVLEGHEVKSLREGNASLNEGQIGFSFNEAYLENVHIAPYKRQSALIKEYNPRRKRKLLLHRNEINRLSGKIKEKGLTLVPLELYFSKKGYVKVLLGLAKGKRTVDKREAIRRKDIDIEMQRELRGRKK